MTDQAYVVSAARALTHAELDDIRGKVQRMRKFSDGLFKIGPLKVGADGLIGLIPGAGDVFMLGAGGYLMHLAWRAQAPKGVMAKMAGWLALDFATGAVPLAGDAIDFFLRGHAKAARELERHLDRVHPPKAHIGARDTARSKRGWL